MTLAFIIVNFALGRGFRSPVWNDYGQHTINISVKCDTDSTKINHPVYSIRMYWTNFRQPTAHVQQNIFGKTLIKVCIPHLYASFGNFCAQIGQLFKAQRVFEVYLNRQIAVIEGKCRFRISVVFRKFKYEHYQSSITKPFLLQKTSLAGVAGALAGCRSVQWHHHFSKAHIENNKA